MEKIQIIEKDGVKIGMLKYVETDNITITYFSINEQYRGNKLGQQFLKEWVNQQTKDINLRAFGTIGKEQKLYQYYEQLGFVKTGKQYIDSSPRGDFIVQLMTYVEPHQLPLVSVHVTPESKKFSHSVLVEKQ